VLVLTLESLGTGGAFALACVAALLAQGVLLRRSLREPTLVPVGAGTGS
jgi:hypothetical protein